jgi:hypothetical protein
VRPVRPPDLSRILSFQRTPEILDECPSAELEKAFTSIAVTTSRKKS